MSHNDWTGFESFTSDELIGMASTPLELEMAKRLDAEIGAAAQLEKLDAVVTVTEAIAIGECVIHDATTTCGLLNTLRDFDIEDIDVLRAVLENANNRIAA